MELHHPKFPNDFTDRPATTYGIYSLFAEDKGIEPSPLSMAQFSRLLKHHCLLSSIAESREHDSQSKMTSTFSRRLLHLVVLLSNESVMRIELMPMILQTIFSTITPTLYDETDSNCQLSGLKPDASTKLGYRRI